MSLLVPGTPFDGDVGASFCHFVHFFDSGEAGASWTAEHAGTLMISVDAYRLGAPTNRAGSGAVLAAGPGVAGPLPPTRPGVIAPAGGARRRPPR